MKDNPFGTVTGGLLFVAVTACSFTAFYDHLINQDWNGSPLVNDDFSDLRESSEGFKETLILTRPKNFDDDPEVTKRLIEIEINQWRRNVPQAPRPKRTRGCN